MTKFTIHDSLTGEFLTVVALSTGSLTHEQRHALATCRDFIPSQLAALAELGERPVFSTET